MILHINDTHGRLMPSVFKDGGSTGGAARVATLIKVIREENPGQTLVLLSHLGHLLLERRVQFRQFFVHLQRRLM